MAFEFLGDGRARNQRALARTPSPSPRRRGRRRATRIATSNEPALRLAAPIETMVVERERARTRVRLR